MKRPESWSEVAADRDTADIVLIADLQRRSVDAGRQEVLAAEIHAVDRTVADPDRHARREWRNRGFARAGVRRDRVGRGEVVVLDRDIAGRRCEADRAIIARATRTA